MPRILDAALFVVASIASVACMVSPAAAATFVGDARGFEPLDVAVTSDGGWMASGARPDLLGRRRGLAMSVRDDGSLAWAVRLEEEPITGIAPLNDGGAVVVAGAVVARIGPDGRMEWQRSFTGCTWTCVACAAASCTIGGSDRWMGMMLEIDAATGASGSCLRSEWLTPEGTTIPRRIHLLPDGAIVVAALIAVEDASGAAVARIAPDGSAAWTRAVTYTWGLQNPDALTVTDIDELAVLADGSLAVVGHDIYGSGSLLVTDESGTATLQWGAVASSIAGTSSGALLGTSESLLWRMRDGVIEDMVALPHSRISRLERLADGSILALGAEVSRLTEGLALQDACVPSAPSSLASTGTARIDGGPAHFAVGTAPDATDATATWIPACAGACIATCEQACADGADDDGNGAADCDDAACVADAACGTRDFDGDGTANDADCAPLDPAAHALPEALLTVAIGCRGDGWELPRLTWAPLRFTLAEPEPPWADVVRGRLADLRRSGGTSGSSCVARRNRGPLWDDWSVQRSNDAYWWLVRPRNACGTGIFGEAGLDGGGGCP